MSLLLTIVEKQEKSHHIYIAFLGQNTATTRATYYHHWKKHSPVQLQTYMSSVKMVDAW